LRGVFFARNSTGGSGCGSKEHADCLVTLRKCGCVWGILSEPGGGGTGGPANFRGGEQSYSGGIGRQTKKNPAWAGF